MRAATGSAPDRCAGQRRPSSARGSARATARSAGDRKTLREESARPSGSRTVGTATISTGRFRSATTRLDHRHLLRVLAAEVRAVRLDDAEQLGAHRRHAHGSGRARRSLQHGRQRAGVDPGVEAGRVELVGRRREEQVDADGLGAVGVRRLVARIAGQVFRGAELRGLTNRLTTTTSHASRAARISAQVAARGRRPWSAPGRSPAGASRLAQRVAHLRDGAHDLHGRVASASAR